MTAVRQCVVYGRHFLVLLSVQNLLLVQCPRRLLLCLMGALYVAPNAYGQTGLLEAVDQAFNIERRQEQQLDRQRERATQRPDVMPDAEPMDAASQALLFPPESPCFVLREIVWDGPSPPPELHGATHNLQGQCLGAIGIKALQDHLTQQLIDQGRVTSRVLVPAQSLGQGRLILQYLPGHISAAEGDPSVGWWRTVLPTGPGGDLNQRDLDQALENIRRLEGQSDATIDVVPGGEPGGSDIRIQPGTGKRWHAYVGGDNGGMQSIDRRQVYAGLTLDSPLFLYDQLSVSWHSNAGWRDEQAHTRAGSINYSVPLGYWMWFASAGESTFRQALPGFGGPLIYGGETKQLQTGVSVVPYRGPAYKGNVSIALVRKRSASTLNDTEISVQRRDVTGYELSVGHRHYLGQVVLDAVGGVRGTWPAFSDRPGFIYGDPDWNGRSTILTAQASAYVPFKLARHSAAYHGSWQLQHATTAIAPADFFTIGGRSTVRGFDGQMSLAAQNGWTWRNDVSINLDPLFHAPGLQLYTGVDMGRVSGLSAQTLPGRTLVGAVLGTRGKWVLPYGSASYDLSVGWPLQKPETLKTAHTVFSAAVMLQF